MKIESFDIPVVLFVFRRVEPVLRILERLSEVKPSKLYILSDGPRNDQERVEITRCRETIESNISWECEVVKNYSDTNLGVYDRLGQGAKWVFEREDSAIFLEDDNLPEVTFFRFCSEMLSKYENDNRVLWICGTNYLESFTPSDDASYMFTKHLLPCGWASWSSKFISMYDGELKLFEDPVVNSKLFNTYENKKLYKQQRYAIERTHYLLQHKRRLASWDAQMAFSLRIHGAYGISPRNNLIKNIGVDIYSTHGGNSFKNVMTRRFCGMDSVPLQFPLKHPLVVLPDNEYEKKIGELILYPFYIRVGSKLFKYLKPIFKIDKFDSFSVEIKKKIHKLFSRIKR